MYLFPNIIELFFGCAGSVAFEQAFSVSASKGYSSLQCVGFSLWWLLLWSTDSRHMGFSSCGFWALERKLSSCGT